jgi:hypothetical protein
VGYAIAGNFHGEGDPLYRIRGVQMWSSKLECCGYGTPVWYPCEEAVFVWSGAPGGVEQLAIYRPSDPKSPIMTLRYWVPFPNLYQSVPDSIYWPGWPEYLGLFQWGNDDIGLVLGKNANGQPVVTGHVYSRWEWYNNQQTFAIFLGVGGEEAAYLSNYVFIPFGAHYPAGGTVIIKTKPFA